MKARILLVVGSLVLGACKEPPVLSQRPASTTPSSVSRPVYLLRRVAVATTDSLYGLDAGTQVNFLNESGYLHARMTGVADTSVTLRRTHFRAADDPKKCAAVSRQIVAGKIQNSRNILLRAARETESESERSSLEAAANSMARQIQSLAQTSLADTQLDAIRGAEGMASNLYFGVFSLLLKQQREQFLFTCRSRRPPRDCINCLLSFLYALVRHDCLAALTAAGLDP
ncbi:MAG: CRISPR-associated endonuclease Cas1, partial [Terrimicrobiaceae bacterium]